MKTFHIRGMLFGGALLFLGLNLTAQELQLPRKSPKASVSYTVGLTQITVHYSSPSVKGRKVWGSLVPYDQVWRAGANEATTIEFSTDVQVEGKDLAAGKYAFFLIPKEGDKWTAIFNTVADQWGAYNYAPEKDALRVEVVTKTAKTDPEERLTYSIIDQAVDKGYIRFAWETKRAYIRFKVDVMEQALANIEEALEKTPDDQKWIVYAQSAEFLSESEEHLQKALQYAEQSTSMFDHSWNWWVKAQIQAKMKDYESALASATKSAEVGQANPNDNYYADTKASIEKTVNEWKTKLN